jgi:hypothetical protein
MMLDNLCAFYSQEGEHCVVSPHSESGRPMNVLPDSKIVSVNQVASNYIRGFVSKTIAIFVAIFFMMKCLVLLTYIVSSFLRDWDRLKEVRLYLEKEGHKNQLLVAVKKAILQ